MGARSASVSTVAASGLEVMYVAALADPRLDDRATSTEWPMPYSHRITGICQGRQRYAPGEAPRRTPAECRALHPKYVPGSRTATMADRTETSIRIPADPFVGVVSRATALPRQRSHAHA